jgi:hypothetical protein
MLVMRVMRWGRGGEGGKGKGGCVMVDLFEKLLFFSNFLAHVSAELKKI